MNKIKKIALALPVFLITASPLIAFAQPVESPIQSLGDVQKVLNSVATWLSTFFFIIAIIFIILAAFQYLTASGDEDKIKKAKQQLIYAIVAIVVALLATGIDNIIGTFLDTK